MSDLQSLTPAPEQRITSNPRHPPAGDIEMTDVSDEPDADQWDIVVYETDLDNERYMFWSGPTLELEVGER